MDAVAALLLPRMDGLNVLDARRRREAIAMGVLLLDMLCQWSMAKS